MAEISAAQVKELREKTGVGMMDCKKALAECQGNVDQAVDYLRKKGLTKAGEREHRIATEGIVASYIHRDGRIGVLLEVNCETDFASRSQDFREFVQNVALQVTSMKPLYIKQEDVPEEVIRYEKEVAKELARNEGKPEKILDGIAEGRVKKYLKEICLLEQEYFRDPQYTIGQLLGELVAKIGEKVSIRRFTRYEVGEGMEKKSQDFAAEVMQEIQKSS
jgi:elongation factor Ts